MNKITSLIKYFPTVQNGRVLDALTKYRNISVSGGGNYSAKVFMIADVMREMKEKTVLWVVNDDTEREHVIRSLRFWSDAEIAGFELLSASAGNIREYENFNKIFSIELVDKLAREDGGVIVAKYTDLMGKFPSSHDVIDRTLKLSKKDKIDMTELFEALIEGGYRVSNDAYLEKGFYHRSGDVLYVFPVGEDYPVRIDTDFEKIDSIVFYDQDDEAKIDIKEVRDVRLLPATYDTGVTDLRDLMDKNVLVVEDELDIIEDYYETWNEMFDELYEKIYSLAFVSFNEDDEEHQHLHFLSVIKYRGVYDLINDLRDKKRDQWKILFFTKDDAEMKGILGENNYAYADDLRFMGSNPGTFIVKMDKEDVLPHAFQNPEMKLIILTDKEAGSLREEKKKHYEQKFFTDFLTGLKYNDYVVHANHGIGRFLGLEKRMIDDVTREYIKIGYAENDKLFVPIDQADKINKFIGADEQPPRLTRLGSAEWNTITKKVQKETEAIAKELLKLYAERKSARAVPCKGNDEDEAKFEATFPYDETPGQIKSIMDVKKDLEKSVPMDRLVCGDVGFGKTEVAMRAAFKMVKNGKQVAVISPITILADQHYRSFAKRFEPFDMRVEMLSRFRSAAEQKKIVKKLERGELDVIIGTHRLLQPDVKFKDLGLVVVDEEQRFGVKQKEAFKNMKKEVHMLTLTATPIPRTLNIALNKLRDISTITTPPPGRLPIITEVRRYSTGLIREAILREVERGGQVYFLHNRVQTIDGMAAKLQALIPEAKFGVAHGKLGASDLEERIMAFKDKKFDVLVSSTIIENGIDLPNANTLLVNNAERLGLAQLYQLRGRVGRGKKQAYAFFLYHGQRLKLDAKKRLRAIVEASELGSGFQIAMKDLEIRGAGDILGAKQHGAINVVGVSHFIRMLNKAVDDLQAGKVIRDEEPEDISIELPVSAYIPDSYIVNAKDKINAYQKMSAADNMEYLTEIRDEMIEEFGRMPIEVMNLFQILELKILAKQAKLVSIKTEERGLAQGKEVVMHMSGLVKPENIMSMLEYNSKWYISGTRLRCMIKDLGLHWMDLLRNSVSKLNESIVDKKK